MTEILVAVRQTLAASLPSASSLNALDVLCLITLGVFALDGLRRGLVMGALDLIALTLTLAAAISLYPVVGTALTDFTELPSAISNVLAFAAVFGTGEAIYLLGAGLLGAVLRP